MSEVQIDGHFQISRVISLKMRAVDVTGSSRAKARLKQGTFRSL